MLLEPVSQPIKSFNSFLVSVFVLLQNVYPVALCNVYSVYYTVIRSIMISYARCFVLFASAGSSELRLLRNFNASSKLDYLLNSNSLTDLKMANVNLVLMISSEV